MAAPEVINVTTDYEDPMKFESLCMECMNNGETTMMLTKIPHFREVVVCSFECPHCGNRNNELQFAGTYGEFGVCYTLKLPEGDEEVRSRQLVKSDSATVTVPELEFEIPRGTQKGTITTVEGMLREAGDALNALQPQRAQQDPETAAAISQFLVKLEACVDGESTFTLVLDDPSGNSYIETPAETLEKDPLLQLEHYERTAEQAEGIGLLPPEPSGPKEASGGTGRRSSLPEIAEDDVYHGHAPLGAAAAHRGLARLQGSSAEALLQRYTAPEEVLEMPGHCGACGAPCVSRMYQTHIPFFKDVILMSDSCDVCGYKSSEVKGGGAISDLGCLITVQVTEQEDLRRDVIKADSATANIQGEPVQVAVPELELEVSTGTLGGLITTVEGLLDSIAEKLKNTQGFHLGDSAKHDQKKTWQSFFAEIERCKSLEVPWTLQLRDPLANSFVSSVLEDPQKDPRMQIEDYVRTEEEDEHFGIDHLKAEEAKQRSQEGQGADTAQKAAADERKQDMEHKAQEAVGA